MFRTYPTQAEAETAQRQKHYQAMLAQYNAYIGEWSPAYQTTITAAFIRQLYGASKDFLDCTLDECWTEGYNRVLGFRNGDIQTDFKGVTTDYATPRETLAGTWAIEDHTDLIGGTVVEDDGTLFASAE